VRVVGSLAVLLSLLAGCVGSGGPSGGGDGAEGPAGCPLTYPDGAPASCAESAFSDVAVTAPPSPATGWLCKDHNADEDTGRVQQVWMKDDGQLGVAWDWTAAPLEGPGAAILVVYQDGADQLVLVPYEDRGFVAFPEMPGQGAMEIHILLYAFGLYVNEVDPYTPEAWRKANVTLLASTFGSDPWFVLKHVDADGERYLPVNAKDRNEAGKEIYRPRGRLLEGDVSLYPVVSGGGAKYPGRDPLQMRANPGFCYVEDLPGPAGPAAPWLPLE
jgi:hypothetical protein